MCVGGWVREEWVHKVVYVQLPLLRLWLTYFAAAIKAEMRENKSRDGCVNLQMQSSPRKPHGGSSIGILPVLHIIGATKCSSCFQ